MSTIDARAVEYHKKLKQITTLEKIKRILKLNDIENFNEYFNRISNGITQVSYSSLRGSTTLEKKPLSIGIVFLHKFELTSTLEKFGKSEGKVGIINLDVDINKLLKKLKEQENSHALLAGMIFTMEHRFNSDVLSIFSSHGAHQLGTEKTKVLSRIEFDRKKYESSVQERKTFGAIQFVESDGIHFACNDASDCFTAQWLAIDCGAFTFSMFTKQKKLEQYSSFTITAKHLDDVLRIGACCVDGLAKRQNPRKTRFAVLFYLGNESKTLDLELCEAAKTLREKHRNIFNVWISFKRQEYEHFEIAMKQIHQTRYPEIAPRTMPKLKSERKCMSDSFNFVIAPCEIIQPAKDSDSTSITAPFNTMGARKDIEIVTHGHEGYMLNSAITIIKCVTNALRSDFSVEEIIKQATRKVPSLGASMPNINKESSQGSQSDLHRNLRSTTVGQRSKNASASDDFSTLTLDNSNIQRTKSEYDLRPRTVLPTIEPKKVDVEEIRKSNKLRDENEMEERRRKRDEIEKNRSQSEDSNNWRKSSLPIRKLEDGPCGASTSQQDTSSQKRSESFQGSLSESQGSRWTRQSALSQQRSEKPWELPSHGQETHSSQQSTSKSGSRQRLHPQNEDRDLSQQGTSSQQGNEIFWRRRTPPGQERHSSRQGTSRSGSRRGLHPQGEDRQANQQGNHQEPRDRSRSGRRRENKEQSPEKRRRHQ